MTEFDRSLGAVKGRSATGNATGKHKKSDSKVSYFHIEGPYRIHLPMLLLVLVLIAFGMIVLFSSSMAMGYADADDALYYVLKQGFFTVLGLGVAAVIILLPVRIYDNMFVVVSLYLLTFGLVVFTLVKGEVVNNARRWVTIGGIQFQPSEIAKVALIICIAGYRSFVVRARKRGKFKCRTKKRQDILNCFMDVVLPCLLLLGCLLIVLMQPHMSFFIIMLIVSAICLLVSGIPLKSWIDGGLILLVILLVGANSVMLIATDSQKDKILGNFEHVTKRLSIFQTLNTDEQSDSNSGVAAASADDVYQSKQSMLAIGSGGLTGIGFGNSRQKYSYLPEAQNDYVFSIACEELGLVGGVSIILLFMAFLWGGLSIAWKSKSDFARILTVGYTCLIAIQAFFNIGVATGLLPPTGVTLPFFSYGGTANFFFMIAAAMILAVSRTGVERKRITYIDQKV